MYSRQIQKHLSNKIVDDIIATEEFQDKYYFKKLVKDKFPMVSDNAIYETIEQCNKLISRPRKKKIYLRLFAKTLLYNLKIKE